MKYALTLTALFLLTACGDVKEDYCHTQNPASDVEMKDRLCDRPNDGGKGYDINRNSDRVPSDTDTGPSVPSPDVGTPDVPDTPTDPEVPDVPTDPEDDPTKGNNGHGNGNDDGTCQGRGCTDDTNPGKGTKNKWH